MLIENEDIESDSDSKGPIRRTILSFLIQPQKGISSLLAGRNSLTKAIIDGPYGQNFKLETYESVLLFAKGIGIAGVIPHALSLIERKTHKEQAYKRALLTRKVDIFWILEESNQMEWVIKWIEELKSKDPDRVSRVQYH